ncbi:hypothetical protein VDGL01_03858 [Verticillium dahliae]
MKCSEGILDLLHVLRRQGPVVVAAKPMIINNPALSIRGQQGENVWRWKKCLRCSYKTNGYGFISNDCQCQRAYMRDELQPCHGSAWS